MSEEDAKNMILTTEAVLTRLGHMPKAPDGYKVFNKTIISKENRTVFFNSFARPKVEGLLRAPELLSSKVYVRELSEYMRMDRKGLVDAVISGWSEISDMPWMPDGTAVHKSEQTN